MTDTPVADGAAPETTSADTAPTTTSPSPAEAAPAAESPAKADAPAQPGNEPAKASEAPATKASGQPTPEDYSSLALPDHSPFDEAYLEDVRTLAQLHKMPAKAAQALIERDHARAEQDAHKSKAAWESTVGEWKSSIKADETYGGDNLRTTVENAEKGLAAHAPPEFIAQLNESGFALHPEFVKFCANVGAAMGESTTVAKGRPASAAQGPDDAKLFPNSCKRMQEIAKQGAGLTS